ncbi:hypothetical protein EVB87_113 [Rhizobium phage RHph_N28_1]|nr:hypothetical protein EVB87_113 [Rhizobium phage RHph_N28_1]QIG74142.1 hypothetical protein EVC07_114 [Rhizobium phage RHph_N42]QXV73800.1 hypothetical protein [Rhizobium phage RHph_N46]
MTPHDSNEPTISSNDLTSESSENDSPKTTTRDTSIYGDMFPISGKTDFIRELLKRDKGFAPGELVFIPSISGERKSNMALSLLSMSRSEREEYLRSQVSYDWDYVPTVWPVRDAKAEERVADMVKESVEAQIEYSRSSRKSISTSTSTVPADVQIKEMMDNPSVLTNVNVRKLVDELKSSIAKSLENYLFEPNG